MQIFTTSDWPALAARMRQPFHRNYYAMYSSVYGGIVTEPALMAVPIDDHMVHRGDGVFEAFKCVGGSVYNLRGHLDRLLKLAERLALPPPMPREEIARTVLETIRAGGQRDSMIRLFLSRGPGSFSANPYDCAHPQLYVVAGVLNRPFMARHPEGARVRSSSVPVKQGVFATIKSCNYLPNVLMKKEAVELGVDYVVAFDERGCLNEGATENFGIVTADRRLVFPKPDRVLYGTTMLRVIELARTLVEAGVLADTAFADIAPEQARAAAEMLITGTTDNVVAAVEFDGQRIGDGRPGPVYEKLSALMEWDIRENRDMLTPAFP